MNVLLVGTDGRAGSGDGARTDTMAVVRVAPDGTVGLLSLPRDLEVPGTGGRLNAVFGTGGAQGLVDTLEGAFGLPVDHVVQVDFEGFMGLVDDLGGLRLAVDVPLRDTHTGLDLAPGACRTVDGQTALALVRARHVDGDPTGDIGRMARARAVLAAAVAQVGGATDDPRELDRLSRLLADHAVLDEGLDLQTLVGLARAVGDLDPARLTAPDLPLTDVTTPDGVSLLRLAPGADAVLRDFGATGPLPAEATSAPGTPMPAGTEPVVGIRPC